MPKFETPPSPKAEKTKKHHEQAARVSESVMLDDRIAKAEAEWRQAHATYVDKHDLIRERAEKLAYKKWADLKKEKKAADARTAELGVAEAVAVPGEVEDSLKELKEIEEQRAAEEAIEPITEDMIIEEKPIEKSKKGVKKEDYHVTAEKLGASLAAANEAIKKEEVKKAGVAKARKMMEPFEKRWAKDDEQKFAEEAAARKRAVMAERVDRQMAEDEAA